MTHTLTPSLNGDGTLDLPQYLKEYYGRRIRTKADFTQSCCSTDDTRHAHQDILELLPEAVVAKHYGCGCPIPPDDLEGLTVVDLGSGAGVDAFILSYLVGPKGHVHGIDMTLEQLAVAQGAVPVVTERFGYSVPNVEFHEDYIEAASSLPDACADLVVSDCVINLSPRKDAVFHTIARMLKPGGEFYLSDIVADRRLPDEIKHNPELVAECIGGAEYEHDYFDLMREAGFRDPRIVKRIVMQDQVKGIPIVLTSLTVRGFKMDPPLDARCEDYGQQATYLGRLPSHPARFFLDDHHMFEAGRPVPVCRNTARMLKDTRLKRWFAVTPPLRHFGLFACGVPTATNTGSGGSSNGSCC